MDIKYRMEEVNTLMCKACQDFLLLIIKDNWQEKLFKTAKNELRKKASGQKNYADKYKEALEKMKDLDKSYEILQDHRPGRLGYHSVGAHGI